MSIIIPLRSAWIQKKMRGIVSSGMLLRHGDMFGILYATHVRSEGFQRFSVGHELGHYFLDGHIDQVLPKDGIHTSYAGFVSADPYELEADQFAAGLLMPSTPFKRTIGRQEAGLQVVVSLAELCKTSLTATAIRYAELTEDAVAIIISTGQVIDFCFMSDTIKTLPQLTWIRKGARVPHGTATARLNTNSDAVANGDSVEEKIDITDWLGGGRSTRATEQALGLGSYGKTLTVLTCPSVQNETYREHDTDDDEDVAERWTRLIPLTQVRLYLVFWLNSIHDGHLCQSWVLVLFGSCEGSPVL